MSKIKNRIELAKHFNELGFKTGAEIGTCYGRFSEILCWSIPKLKLIAVDNWNNRINSDRERKLEVPGEIFTRIRLKPYNNVTVLKKDSIEAAKEVPNGSLDFVFIDANHSYNAVKADIEAWSPKVRKGGIVSGHDYYIFSSGRRGIVDAVDEYAKNNNIKLQVIERDRDSVVSDDRLPCWFFVK